MKTNVKTTTGKGALGFIFSVVLLDVIGLAILMPVQAARSTSPRFQIDPGRSQNNWKSPAAYAS
jgi:hypothetical protein